MSVAALSTFGPGRFGPERREFARWGTAFGLVLGLHVAGLVALLASRAVTIEASDSLPAIMVDLAPPPSAPTLAPAEAPPSEAVPEMTAPDPVADVPPDVPVPDVTPPDPPPAPPMEEVKPPPPKQETTAVALPPPPPKVAPKPKPKEKAVERKPRKPVQAKRGEVQTERRPPAQEAGAQATGATSLSSGSSAASRSSWQGSLVAHLRRHLQPQNGQTGTASVRFTMSRSGSVMSAALVSSAGLAALDAEAVAVVRRSQPLPAAPAEVPGSTFTFTIPVRFTTR